jgi:hypothetical protein
MYKSHSLNKRNKKELLSAEEKFKIYQDAKQKRDSMPQKVKFECANCGAPLKAEHAICDYCGMRSKPKDEFPAKEEVKYV